MQNQRLPQRVFIREGSGSQGLINDADVARTIHVNRFQCPPAPNQVILRGKIVAAAPFQRHVFHQHAVLRRIGVQGDIRVNARHVVQRGNACKVAFVQPMLDGRAADRHAHFARAQGGELARDFARRAADRRNQRDNRCHADDDAQHRQEGAHFVAADVLPRHANALFKHLPPLLH